MARGCDVDAKSAMRSSLGCDIEEAARYLICLPNLVIQAIDISNEEYAGEQEDAVG